MQQMKEQLDFLPKVSICNPQVSNFLLPVHSNKVLQATMSSFEQLYLHLFPFYAYYSNF